MKYPITLIHEENRPDTVAEIVQLLNDAYNDGLRGAGSYPLDLEQQLSDFAKYSGKSLDRIRKSKLLPPLIEWMNRAYEAGRKEAGQNE